MGAASAALLGSVGALEGCTQTNGALGKLILNTNYGHIIGAKLPISAGLMGAIVGGLANYISWNCIFWFRFVSIQEYKNNTTQQIRYVLR